METSTWPPNATCGSAAWRRCRPSSSAWPASPGAAPTRWPTSTSTPWSGAPIEKLQHELVVFGRIDDDQPWRVGLYGIDRNGEQLVIDWRAPFAGRFYQARFDEPLGLERRVTYVGSIVDLFVEDFATGEVSGTSPLLGELSRSRGSEMRTAVATLQSEQDELVRLDPDRQARAAGRARAPARRWSALHRAAWLVYNDTRLTAGRILVIGPSDRFLRFVAAVLPDARRGPDHADHLRPAPRPVVRGRAATSAGSTCSTGSRPRIVQPGRDQGRAAPHRRRRGRRAGGAGRRADAARGATGGGSSWSCSPPATAWPRAT